MLLERQDQIADLTSLAESACAGAGSAVVLEGPAGIGKTSVLGAAQAEAQGLGMSVLTALGTELERDFAFGAVRQLFEGPVHTASPARRRAMLAGAASLARPLLAGPSQAIGPTAAQDGFAVVHGLYWLCVNLAARTPLMIVLDDAHWADEPSLRWLHFLCGRVEELRVLVVLSTRSDELLAQGGVLGAIRLDDRNRTMRLAALSEMAVDELVRTHLGDRCAPEFCRACHAVTGGNPFYLGLLLNVLEAEGLEPTAKAVATVLKRGPETLGAEVLRRLDRLGAAASALARAVAILAPEVGLRDAAGLAGLEQETAARMADRLSAMHIFASAGPLNFVHPIVRSAVYTHIPRWERAQLHRRAAALLAGRDRQEAVAGQLLVSEPAGEAWSVAVLRGAAREALQQGAPDVAVAFLRRCLAEPPPPGEQVEVLMDLGQAAFLSGDPSGPRYLRQALAMGREGTQRASIALELGKMLVVADRIEEAVETLAVGVKELGDANPELSMSLEAQLIAAAMVWKSSGALGRDRLRHWRRTAVPDSPAGRLMLADLALGGLLDGLPAIAVRELGERAMGAGRLLTEQTAASQFFYLAANALCMADHLDLGLGWLDKAVDQAGTQGSRVAFALACCWRSDAAYRMGRLLDAEADARASLEAAGAEEWWGLRPLLIGHLLQILIERGDLEAAARLLRDQPLDVDPAGSMFPMLLRYQRGRLCIAQGRVRDGVQDILSWGRWEENMSWRNPSCWPWRSNAALGLARMGEFDTARRLAAEEVELARPLGQPRTLGMALRAAGLVANDEHGLELLQEALTVLATGPSPLEYARALVGLGGVHRRHGHRNDARRALSQGLDLAHRCGATMLMASAQEELRLTGARPRRLRTTGLMALTPAERRIAQMAADGLSNPEIGQALFNSLKTVETHLSRVYNKLGINSRAALAGAIARELDD